MRFAKIFATFDRVLPAAMFLSLCFVVDGPRLFGEDSDEVVVLKNGGLFVGEVAERDGLIIVQLPRGEVRLNPETVDFRAPSIKDVYAILVRRLIEGDPKQHLGLSDWCVSQALLREADIQLELAARSGADPRAVDRRRRQLNSLMELERQRRLAALQPQADPNNETPEISPTPLPNESNASREPAKFSPTMPATELPANGVSASELAESEPTNHGLTDVQGKNVAPEYEFSEEIFVAFRREIQPRMIHGCAASSCHGPSALGGFELERVARGRPVTKGMTERNLRQVMKLINPTSPRSSKLLRVATERHAGLRAPIIPRHESESFQQLENWVLATGEMMVAQHQSALPRNAVVQANSEAISNIPRLNGRTNSGMPENENRTTGPIRRTEYLSDSPGSQDDSNAGNRTSRTDPGGTENSSGAEGQSPPFRPIDAFDPEIFNRYATGRLIVEPEKREVELLPIPEDPIGRPSSQIAPPSRDKSPGNEPERK